MDRPVSDVATLREHRFEVVEPAGGRGVRRRGVDPCVTVRDDVAEADRLAQPERGARREHLVIGEPLERLGRGGRRGEAFVRDRVSREIAGCLHREHPVERHEVERVAIRRELGGGRATMQAHAGHAVCELALRELPPDRRSAVA